MALRTLNELRSRLAEQTPTQWPVLLEQAYRRLDKFGFDTLGEFITTPYQKGGLGIDMKKAIHLIEFNPAYAHKVAELKQKLNIVECAKNTQETVGQGKSTHSTSSSNKDDGRTTEGDGIILDKTENVKYNTVASGIGGNSKQYRIAKLKRDFPEVAQRLMDGEFKSVSEAERAAGLGRQLMSPVDKVLNAYNKLSTDEKDEFNHSITKD